VGGGPELFNAAQVARAASEPVRLPGLDCFNPKSSLPANEQFFVAVHELGHVFGLPHNPSASSITSTLMSRSFWTRST
jgi:predicted Zn-dependent protease